MKIFQPGASRAVLKGLLFNMQLAITILQLICALAVVLIVLFQSGKSAGLSGAIGGISEAFAAKNNVLASLCDGVGIGIGFTLALTLLGLVRELLGNGSLFGMEILPESMRMLVFVLAPGAFITLGLLIAIVNKIKN